MTRLFDEISPARFTWIVALIAAAALLLAACAQQTPPVEEPPPGPPPDPAVELALDRSTVEVLRGGTALVEVTLVRIDQLAEPAGAEPAEAEPTEAEPAVLSLEGSLPTGVTATFDPPELTGTDDSSTLTMAVDAAVAETSLDLEVVVDAGELSSRQALVVEVVGLTVMGLVEDHFGQPLAGGRAGSQGQTVLIGADGSFTLNGLAVPYDLMVGSGPAGRLHVFEGLTDPAPVLVPYGELETPVGDGASTIAGKLLDGDALASDERVTVCVEGHLLVIYNCAFAFGGDDEYTFDATWFGDLSQGATLHAIHYLEGADDETIAYLGYDSLEVTLSDGATTTWDITFEPVGSSRLAGTIERGTGIASGMLVVVGFVRLGQNLAMLVSGVSDEEDFSILVPDLPETAPLYDLAVADGYTSPESALAWRSAVGPDVGTVKLLDMPQVTGPANAEVGVSLTTPFGVVGLEGQVKTFIWSGAAGTGPMIALTTTRDAVTIPNPAALGLGGMLPRWQNMGWGVSSSTRPDVDSATTEFREMSGLVMALFRLGSLPPGEGSYVSIGEREFGFGLPP